MIEEERHSFLMRYFYDEIRINAKPRYKTSNGSGDEWRTGFTYTFMNKGEIILTFDVNEIDSLCFGNKSFYEEVVFIKDMFRKLYDENKLRELMIKTGNLCDQIGCLQPSTVTYKLKYLYFLDGEKVDPYINDKCPLIRKFCDRHSTRGDCDYEDSDSNYEIIHGNRIPPLKEDMSESGKIFL